jgi:hypothetical protein
MGYLNINGRIILKLTISKKYEGVVWIHLAQYRKQWHGLL